MKNDFHEILRDRRKVLGISQEELAKKTRIEKTYMSKLEGAKSNPSFSTIQKICKSLGMTLSEFFGGIEEQRKEPAAIFIKPKERKQAFDEYRIKSEMVPIKVFKDISVFSQDRDIKTEIVLKYTYVEKSTLGFHPDDAPNPQHYEKVVGLQLDHRIDLLDFKLKRDSILLIDIDMPIMMSPSLCIVDTGDGKGASLQRFARLNNYTAFFNPKKDPLWHEATYLFKKEDFNKDIIRGTIVGAIGVF